MDGFKKDWACDKRGCELWFTGGCDPNNTPTKSHKNECKVDWSKAPYPMKRKG